MLRKKVAGATFRTLPAWFRTEERKRFARKFNSPYICFSIRGFTLMRFEVLYEE